MIYVLLADGFEEIEALEPVDIMRRAGLEVQTVGVTGKTVTGAHDIKVEADIEIAEVNADNIELLMLPGGMGYVNLENSELVQRLIEYSEKNDKYISAICAAPSILGKLGLLKGKKATCFPGFERFLDGAELSADKAVCDGKIITGKGAGAAADFAFLMVELLTDKNNAEELRKVMQY